MESETPRAETSNKRDGWLARLKKIRGTLCVCVCVPLRQQERAVPVSTLLDSKAPPNLVVETPNFIMLRDSVSREFGHGVGAQPGWLGCDPRCLGLSWEYPAECHNIRELETSKDICTGQLGGRDSLSWALATRVLSMASLCGLGFCMGWWSLESRTSHTSAQASRSQGSPWERQKSPCL